MIHTYLPSVLSQPEPQAGIAVYRALKQARELIEQMDAASDAQEDEIQATMDDLGAGDEKRNIGDSHGYQADKRPCHSSGSVRRARREVRH